MILWGIERVAEELGLTSGRVRQLARTEGFPAPIRIAGLFKVKIWPASDIRAWMAERDDVIFTLPLHGIGTEAPSVTASRSLFLPIPSGWRSQGDVVQIHVRLFYRADGSVVGVVAMPRQRGVYVLGNRFDEVCSEIHRAYLQDVPSSSIAWVRLSLLDDLWTEDAMKDEFLGETLIESYRLAIDTDSNGGPAYSNGPRRLISREEFEFELGRNGASEPAPLTWFPWAFYTTEVIQAHDRDPQSPVPVIDDPLELRSIVDALDLIDSRHGLGDLPEQYFDNAKHALLVTLALWVESGSDELRRKMRKQGMPWSPGVVAVQDYVVPAKWASRLPLKDGLHGGVDWAEGLARYKEALLAVESVDEYADLPRPHLLEPLELVAGCSATLLQLIDSTRALQVSPREFAVDHPRNVSLHEDKWDRQYYEGCEWLGPLEEALVNPPAGIALRDVRRLAKVSWGPAHLGRDSFGHFLALTQDSARTRSDGEPDVLGLVAVLWPTHYDLPGAISESAQIVATGAVGDRPVYISVRGKLVGLLPNPRAHDGWNFGYSGGGPGSLASSIHSLLEGTGAGVFVSRTDIEKDVESSPKSELVLTINEYVQPDSTG